MDATGHHQATNSMNNDEFLLNVLTVVVVIFCFFFFNDTATTEIYTLSLHDALPICNRLKAVILEYVVNDMVILTACTVIGPCVFI